LPESAKKCIASWRKFLPDYEIIEWNEDNYDVNKIPYTAEAYAAKKYAFVSDYARFDILYQHGGLYFDTDVEVIKPFDDIVANGPFMGCEIDAKGSDCPAVAPGLGLGVNPGLGLGVNPGLGLYKEILDYYSQLHYLIDGEIIETGTVVCHTTKVLQQHGLIVKSGIQKVAGVTIYPKEYFNPLDDNTGKLTITANTHSIHWFSKTWCDVSPLRIRISRLAHRLFGHNFPKTVRKIFHIK
jgi:hypothetical protein